MREKIRMWEFTQDGKLKGTVAGTMGHRITIVTSRITDVRANGADTVIRTQSGSEYQLDGPSRLDLIREADQE